MWAEFFHADGQTDMTKIMSLFATLQTRLKILLAKFHINNLLLIIKGYYWWLYAFLPSRYSHWVASRWYSASHNLYFALNFIAGLYNNNLHEGTAYILHVCVAGTYKMLVCLGSSRSCTHRKLDRYTSLPRAARLHLGTSLSVYVWSSTKRHACNVIHRNEHFVCTYSTFPLCRQFQD